MAILVRGLRGTPVKMLQEKLGLEADGIFGAGTEKAVKTFQRDSGLAVDGIAGADTFAAMGLYDLILLRRGSKGDTVKKVQEALGTDADGKFGQGTERMVRDFQEARSMDADGVVGPATIGALRIFDKQEEAAGANPDEEAATAPPAVASAKDLWSSLEEASDGALAKVKKLLPFDIL